MRKQVAGTAGTMSDPQQARASATHPNITSHRSVNVQKITKLSAQLSDPDASAKSNNSRNLVLAQLWSQCASSVPYTSSVATAAIVDLVRQESLDWNDAVQGFENALSTAQGQVLVNIIHSLTSLFITAAEELSTASKTKTMISGNIFGIKNNRHPFITLICAKAQVETILLVEMDKILEHRPDSSAYRIAALEILSPFLDFCLLDQHERNTIVSSSVLLWIAKTLNACLLDSDLEPFVVHLIDYLCSIPNRYPLERSQPSATLQASIRTLVDFYCLPSTQLTLSSQYKDQFGGRLLLILLSRMADMRRFGLTTLPLLQTAQALFRNRKGYTSPTLPFDTLWPLLSFLLMNSPTVDEQRIIVDWMYAVIVALKDTPKAMIANLAFLPIFQVMGESTSEAVSKKCSEILQTLETLPRTMDSQLHVNKDFMDVTGVAAMILANVARLNHVWNASGVEDQGIMFTLGDDSILSSLIYTTFMFHPAENVRIEAMTQQMQVEDGRLVTLVLFIYLLRVDPAPSVKLHLLQEAIPSLVTSKDEMVTAKVLRTILTLINGVPNAPSGSKIMNTHMGAVGVRILFLIWKRQPRVWKTLRHVIHGWVENRPRLFKTPLKGEPEYDMEVAVLTTIRDICAFDAAGYAEVLIPFLANLLGSVELYASSICIIIETMNLTVEANVVEPRAAEYAMKTRHPGMLIEMCVFYGIVGSRSEDTQVFLDMREVVLANYIQPLLTSDDPGVLAAVLKALASFTAPEILATLPSESPSLYIRQQLLEAQDPLVVDEYSLVLDKLVRHELAHMRRGLFKDAASKKAAPDALSGTKELDRLEGVMSVVAGNILQKWQSGDVNPGLRTGYALSSLLCTSVMETKLKDSVSEDGSLDAIRAQQNYRNVMTALKDVTLTDHLVERISALEGWTSLFDNMWAPNDDAQTLIIAETLISDLYKKITDGYVPAHCANALFAITASTVQSSVLAKHLLQNFVHPETLSDVGGSDEVQFAVLVSLSFITPLAAVDEKLVASVLAVFTSRLQDDAANLNSSSELSSWATFAAGWSFCNLLAGLVDAPTKTVELNNICQVTLKQLLSVLESNTTSFALTLGILIAFSRLSVAIASSSSQTKDGTITEEVESIQKVKAMARNDLETFVDNQQQNMTAQELARLLGAPWVISFSDRTDASPDERKTDTSLLDRALLAASSRRDLQQQLVHFTVPFCHMIHHNLDVRNPTSSDITLFTGRIHSLVNLIRITPTSAARHTAVVALGSLFGIDWSRGPMITSAGGHGLFSYLTASTNHVAMASVTNSALTTLTELSGLSITITSGDTTATTSPSIFAVVNPGIKAPSAKLMLMTQDLKAGRLAAVILGQVACLFHRLGQVDTGRVIGTSSEPKDFSRLPVSTSWLRAIWDGLWEPLQMGTAQRAQKSFAAGLELLLYTVHSLPTPLPAVNWFPLLTQLVTLDPQLVVPAIHMASKHATTSTSLMEFLIMSMSNFKAKGFASGVINVSAEELFVGEEGLGRILTLGGLPLAAVDGDQALAELDKVRGLDGLARRVTLPNSRVIDLVEKLVKELFLDLTGERSETNEDSDMEVLMLMFLDTLSNHMRQYRQVSRSSSIITKTRWLSSLSEDARELLTDLRAVILRVFYQVTFTRFITAQRVLRRLADLSLMSFSHLEAARLDAHAYSSEGAGATVLKEAIGIASLYRAGYLTVQQEGKLTQVAQSALLILVNTPATGRSTDKLLAESAISVLLYAMNAGVGDRTPLTGFQQKKKDLLRLTWLQRILDLLVLLSSQQEAFKCGITLLLGGAVLLWWDKQDMWDHQENVGKIESRAGTGDDAEANLLAMVEDHDLQQQQQHQDADQRFNSSNAGWDYNILEDDEFEAWHEQFAQSVSLHAQGDETFEYEMQKEQRHQSVHDRMSLVLPDIIMSIRGNGASSSDSQIAGRLLRLALDTQVKAPEKLYLVTLLRRMEDLVPQAQSWLLK
ncbi:hypothetical protein BG011_009148 [Mortierella polycephala]|uniref:DUF3730 domain-containing protein n=1 Tax=Mortierella polycephala TaxID=41804 RepID=A0A9P6QF62_9FUNG|nr:hypothetical protein BG011_009148 [Mortierella polycephala]